MNVYLIKASAPGTRVSGGTALKKIGKCLVFMVWFSLLGMLNYAWSDEGVPPTVVDRAPFGAARPVGRLADERLVECSGMDVSATAEGLFWAVNDGGHGPFLYALREDGRSLGRVRVRGARNRDWEGLDTFRWRGRPMILIADFGDNKAQHDMHTLYIVHEPRLNRGRPGPSAVADVAWRIVFTYPDRHHDAEGVAVDRAGKKVLVLTKRDTPPLLFELPLEPLSPGRPVVARKVASVGRIPPPSASDLLQKYGPVMPQPTALDISADGRKAVVLTYKHAYLFERGGRETWSAAFNGDPIQIPLPLPWDASDLRQREAICFSPDDRSLFVTSEGRGAGIFRLVAR
jgi:hypothetical protein